MTLFERLTKRAQENRKRLVLPESLEPRTLQAANRVIESAIADVTFIGRRDQKPSQKNLIKTCAVRFFALSLQ